MPATITNLRTVLEAQLKDTSCSFSIGSFGAIAEFFRRVDECVSIEYGDGLTVSTDRGAIRICLRKDVFPVAYETLSARKNCWLQGLALCLPIVEGTSCGRTTITELGPDVGAIRSGDDDDLLFDLGLGAKNIDFCIRTSNPDLIRILRRAVGSALLTGDHSTMASIISYSPHRIVLSNLGRIEVYQAIGHYRTPEGPHTHILPKLIQTGRTHDAKISIPRGYLPCCNIYPASPLFDSLGKRRPYDRENHLAFDAVLRDWGIKEYVLQKDLIFRFVREKIDPASCGLPKNQLQRIATRIALRQLAHEQEINDQVNRWQKYFKTEDQEIENFHDPHSR